MPEIKNVFRSGIMNKDDDERIIPNGQYRDAMNIEVATSEGSEVGTVQNILGNIRVDGLSLVDYKCIGAIADEKNDVLYWFITSLAVDAIIEYHDNGTVTPILIDVNKDVLKFDPSDVITGINIIDNLLFWTDNVNEPKKINIDTFKLNSHQNLSGHSDMYVGGVSVGPVTEDHLTVIRKKPNKAPKIKFEDTVVQRQYDFGRTSVIFGQPIDISDGTGLLPLVGDTLTLGHTSGINYFNPFEYAVGDIILLSRDIAIGNLPQNYELKLQVLSPITTDFYDTNANTGQFEANFEILEINSAIPINQEFQYNAQKLSEDKSLFETEFVRFATRYKYADGEYSAFSPFTQPVFLTGSYGFHPTKHPHNLGMENKIINLKLQDLIPLDTPTDVVQLDILFKKESSTTVYSIDSIKPTDPGSPNNWNKSMDATILSTSWTDYNDDTNQYHTTSNGGYTGEYSITTENIYAALPANQTLRPWDNVPRQALAQEITANRLIYGNYIQNYDLVDFVGNACYVDTTLGYEVRGFQENNVVDFSTGQKSIKSDRTYYLGVVYGDEYGRETPVFTGKDSSINVPFDLNSGPGFNGASSNSLRLKARLKGPQPEWAYYYKYFIKQTTGEYYNLVVDRVYKSIQDQSLWLSLPSSDRNKLKEEDYFTIKKQVSVETQVPVESKIKVIDIKNEAPDSIKFDYTTLGTGGGGEDDLAALFPDSNGKPAENVVRIAIDKETWIETEFGANLDDYTRSDKFAMQFSIKQNGSNTFSEMYFVSTAYEEDAGVSGRYIFILRKKITSADSWVESSPGILNATDQLTVELFVLEEKNAVEFEGRFFVKIASNPITQTYLIPSANNVSDNILTARAYSYWLANSNTADNVTQITNKLFNCTSSWTPNITGVTSDEGEWAAALKFDTEAESSSGWFIDNLGFVAAQGPFEVNNVWDASFSGRMTKGNPLIATQQVNGLEGILEINYGAGSGNPYRQDGSRTWRKRPNIINSDQTTYLAHPDDTASTLDFTNTYEPKGPYADANANKGIFMHFSFSSCGADLHDGDFGEDDSILATGDETGFKKSLQWIASSGIDFDDDDDGVFTVNDSVGHNFAHFNANVTAVGLEAHDAQFDPVYTGGPSASSVINSLTTGNQFKIEGDDSTVYTIQGVDVKYLYNHTTWNQMLVSGISSGSVFRPNNSVSGALEDWRDAGFPDSATELDDLKERIVNFGKANNRRVVYIVQLDKDPKNAASGYNILDTADVDTFNAINFIDTYIQPGSNTLPTSPAILETEAKEDQDLNIYFEISDALPRILDLTDGTGDSGLISDYPIGAFGSKVDAKSVKGHLLAPVGSRVTVNNAPGDPGEADYSNQNTAYPEEEFYLRVAAWDGNILTLESPGLEAQGAGTGQALTKSNAHYGEVATDPHKTLTFWREDGGYTKGAIYRVREVDADNNYVTKVELFPLCHGRDTGLGYYNCFSFGNGVESNRIRDDFNASIIRNGVKASTTLEEPYTEERRKYGLIYSGLYNSTSGVNNLNQFIQAEKITKDVNPIHGSIQKLYARDRDLVTLCEDKILKVFVDRDVLYNADGNQQLLATNNVLGSVQPFSGNYGISKNPESFAAESFRAYFTDKQRGAVLRLSMDGLTAISDAGMSDFFRDNLRDGRLLYGSYDAYKKDYNLTINYGIISDIVCNPGFEEGLSTDVQLGSNIVLNQSFNNTTIGFTSNLLSTANSGFEGTSSWGSQGSMGSAGAIYSSPSVSPSTYGTLSALFFHEGGLTYAPNGTALTQLDISALGINDGEVVKIEWEMYTAGDHAADQFVHLTTADFENAKPSTDPFKVTLHNGNSGAIITNSDITAVSGGGYDNQYSFTKTMNIGNSPGGNANKLRIISQSLEEKNHVFIDNVSVKKEVTTTDDWTLDNNVVNNGGALTFSDGGEAVQTGSNLIEAGKTYRITCSPSAVSGIPRLTVNGMLVSSSPQDITFPSSSNSVTLLVIDGGINLPSITIQEVTPYGGNVDCWDLNGADSDFLYTSQSGSGGSVVFDEAPEDTYLHQPLINTHQILDFTDGTTCNVSFNITNYTGSGELTFTLYNDEGEGFEYPISGNGSYSFSSTIGNDSSSTLTSIFGFYVSSTDTFSGEVDNVNIVLDSNNSGKTISFNEKSKGWTSLKSFIPEFAISSVNQYYTMNFGQLWKHHIPGTDRNTFYDVFEDSSVTPVLNTQPEVVKNFNTLNYEGSQSRVDEHLTDNQYYNLETKKGWFVEDIHTDKQEGTLSEFIEKEGKWFNYIKGKPGQVDTAAFNFQGLGIIQDIEIGGCTIPTATNFDPSAVINDGSCGFASGAFELQLRDTTSPSNADGAVRVVYVGTNIEATGLTRTVLNPITGLMQVMPSYAWSNGATTSELTGLSMGPIGLTLTDGQGNIHNFSSFIAANVVNGCTDPTATNFNYSANTDDGTCTI